MPSAVIDATEETFQATVLEASKSGPVVVDFWAEWCGPCKALSPIIERVAGETGVTLVKVNTEDNPQLAQAFRITSIPNVKAFRDGKVIAEFLGAQPEPAVRRFFQELAPSPADRLAEAGIAALVDGDIEAAREQLQAALQIDADNAPAIAALADILIREDDLDAAEALVERVPTSIAANRQALRIRLIRGARSMSREDAERTLEATPGDSAARYALACHLARTGAYADALEHLLEVVITDRAFGDDAARRLALLIFEILGPQDPTTVEYRGRLQMALF